MTWEIWNGDAFPIWLIFLVNIGAVYRIARFIARDTLLEKPRTKITTKYHGALVTLILCMWCLSFWFAIMAVLLTSWDSTREWWLVIASILSIASAVGFLSEKA